MSGEINTRTTRQAIEKICAFIVRISDSGNEYEVDYFCAHADGAVQALKWAGLLDEKAADLLLPMIQAAKEDWYAAREGEQNEA